MLDLPTENRLALFQRSFAEAVFFDDAPIPATIRAASGPACGSRFGVYRNNVIAGLTRSLASRYPVVRRLLWDDVFDRVARLYVTMEPPRSPVLLEYGEGFPRFLRKLAPGAATDYVADVAELESARVRAYHAADAVPVGRDAFSGWPADRLPRLRLMLHPSVILLKSRFPMVSIWETHRRDEDTAIREWRQEAALIARPGWQVEVHRLTHAGHEFFSALACGRTVGSAVAQATTVGADFDLAAAFTLLISANIVVGLEASQVAPDTPLI
jgi:hypothetical protein